jgi:hypothetical protein
LSFGAVRGSDDRSTPGPSRTAPKDDIQVPVIGAILGIDFANYNGTGRKQAKKSPVQNGPGASSLYSAVSPSETLAKLYQTLPGERKADSWVLGVGA